MAQVTNQDIATVAIANPRGGDSRVKIATSVANAKYPERVMLMLDGPNGFYGVLYATAEQCAELSAAFLAASKVKLGGAADDGRKAGPLKVTKASKVADADALTPVLVKMVDAIDDIANRLKALETPTRLPITRGRAVTK